MSTHHRCEWNCSGTDCDAPRRPNRADGPSINLGFYAGTYGGTRDKPPMTPPALRRGIGAGLVLSVMMVAVCALIVLGLSGAV